MRIAARTLLRQHGWLLALVALALLGHALLHAYASRLADSGALLRGGKRVASTTGGGIVASTGCSSASGKLSILLIHEHHLKPIGSDVRLLGVVLQLRSLGHTVSLLFRGKTPADQRSPPTAELATLIATAYASEHVLTSSAVPPQPPAIYEHADLDSLSLLARQGWFDVVLCPLWFWRDPMASAAELLLPTLAFHAPPGRRPFLGILSDDAHSAKASMMAEWESSDERKSFFEDKARTLPLRQRAVYALADAVVHISDADSALERKDFNASCAHWHVLRMSPRGAARPAADDASRAAASAGLAAAGGAMRFGFMGNGITPTNHLSVQWFLQQVWPKVRSALPGVRLRLVGYAPDDRARRLQGKPCDPATSTVRCGWAWNTPYAGKEVAGGIDELGFVTDEEMLIELLTWRSMVVPILRSTGVNTKLLPALMWGIPTILTTVAASPLGIPIDDSVALLADDANTFVRQIQRVHSSTAEAARLASAAMSHWQRLLTEDAHAADLTPLLGLACDVLLHQPEAGRPMPMPIAASAAPAPASTAAAATASAAIAGASSASATSTTTANSSASAAAHASQMLRTDLLAARQEPPSSRCFDDDAPAVYVSMHSAAASEGSVLLAHTAWAAICSHCQLRCIHGRGGRPPPTHWDVLLEHESTVTPDAIASSLSAAATALTARPLWFVHAPAAQFPAALGLYSSRGGVLASISHGELARARLPAALSARSIHTWATLPLDPISNGTRGAAVAPAWRGMLKSLGVRTSDVALLVGVIERLRARLQMAAPKWVGCYRDHAAARELVHGPTTSGHTSLACAAACCGYPYFSLQNGGQCFCAAHAANHSRRAAIAQCGKVCATEEGKLPPRLCGGGWRNAVYANPATLLPSELLLLGGAGDEPRTAVTRMGKEVLKTAVKAKVASGRGAAKAKPTSSSSSTSSSEKRKASSTGASARPGKKRQTKKRSSSSSKAGSSAKASKPRSSSSSSHKEKKKKGSTPGRSAKSK